MRTQTVLALLLLSAVLASAALPQPTTNPSATADALQNLDFEAGEPGEVPSGWFVPPVIAAEGGYEIVSSEEQPHDGRLCAVVARSTPPPEGRFGNLMRSFDATPYRGQQVRFRAFVRAAVEGPESSAALWLRVDREPGKSGFFENMHDRPIRDASWQPYEIVGHVHQDAERINVGMMLHGRGRAYLDDVSFEILGPADVGHELPRALTERGLENLVAFARLYGYLRYFHPSDQAAKADWDVLAIAGAQMVEPARDPRALADALARFAALVAPTARIYPSGEAPPPLPEALEPPPADGPRGRVTAWEHHGFGFGLGSPNVYSSRRIKAARGSAGLPDPAETYAADLGGGVTASVPLAVLVDIFGTLPRSTADVPRVGWQKPEGFRPSGGDRATRLAAVIIAWNVLEHFYPYFDVAGGRWPGSLERALQAAATDPGAEAFESTLRRLVAALDDGHGNVYRRATTKRASLALRWRWIEDQVVITGSDAELLPGVGQGVVVTAIDGVPMAKALAKAEDLISAATPQRRHRSALAELAWGHHGAPPVRLDLRRADGATTTVEATYCAYPGNPILDEPRPKPIAELEPGVFYVDLSRIDDDAFTARVEELAAAGGVIFDLRGYPQVSTVVLAHLTDEPLASARWLVPEVRRPHRAGLSFAESSWSVEPEKPRFRGKIAFMTDERAISYAETYLGIVEHYRLAEIVGQPTAGTNGNVNPFELPGGYRVLWTGMKVLKHDGSRHHGVGIQPTIPVAPTLAGILAGRDEVLERAVEVVRPAPAIPSGSP